MLDKLYRPVKGYRNIDRRLTQKYGDNFKINWKWMYWEIVKWWNKHEGLDYAGPNPWDKIDIYAAHTGIVQVLNDPKWFGMYIIIDGWEFTTYYAHLWSTSVKSWETVVLNQKIWTMWTSGNSTAVHLHFGLRSKDRSKWYQWWLDPTPYISDWEAIKVEAPVTTTWELPESDRAALLGIRSWWRADEFATRKEVAIMALRVFDMLKNKSQ